MGAAGLLLALAFAFPNEQGTRLLVTADIAKPEVLRIALCKRRAAGAVQFERRRRPSFFSLAHLAAPHDTQKLGD